jgi:16S rRNA U516 pseudouridylate synthase RsuA-like enzyme
VEKLGGTGRNGGDNGTGTDAGNDDQERRPSAPGARSSGMRGARAGAKPGGRGERRGDTLRFVLREGRNRQIRKMLSALG